MDNTGVGASSVACLAPIAGILTVWTGVRSRPNDSRSAANPTHVLSEAARKSVRRRPNMPIKIKPAANVPMTAPNVLAA